jgi:malate dehydrogenase (decarboxylating)
VGAPGGGTFNDDIQGTAAVAVSGVYGALACQGLPAAAISQQRFVVVGAGSAGSGVIRMLAAGMRKHGLSESEAASRFHVLDKDGLITASRPGLEPSSVIRPFAAAGPGDVEGEDLESVVRRVRPTGLIGLAGAGRIFTPAVLAALGEGTARPLVFAMSNPTSRMECTSRQAAAATGGRAIFASGSPQPDVPLDGAGQPLPPGAPHSAGARTFASSQSNNSAIFPGLARGAFLGQTGRVSARMLTAAAEALPALLTQADLDAGRVYPSLADPRRVAAHVAARVLEAAAAEGRVTDRKALRALEAAAAAAAEAGKGGGSGQPSDGGDSGLPPLDPLAAWVRAGMYEPEYKTCIRLPMGVMGG